MWSNQIYIFKAWYFSYLLGSHFEWLICHFELEFFLEAEFHLRDATKRLGSDRHPLHNPIWYLHHSKLSHHRVLAKNMVWLEKNDEWIIFIVHFFRQMDIYMEYFENGFSDFLYPHNTTTSKFYFSVLNIVINLLH